MLSRHTHTSNDQDLCTGETREGAAILSEPALAETTTTYTHNAANQLLHTTDLEATFTYDADGNLTQGYTPQGEVFTAAYDAENRLTSLEYTDKLGVARKTEYAYSGDDFLAIVKQYENGTLTDETRIVRDGFLALQDRNGQNVVRNEYTWGLNLGGGIGGLLDLKQGGVHYSCFYDGKGNVEAVFDWEKNVAAAYRYDPFGKLLAKTGALDQPFRFSTKRFDERSGLSYYGYRFYSPEMGRWTTRDPLGETGGVNLYAFVGNNPANWVDPWGQWVCNNSPKPVYFKPAGKNDYPTTILDESAAEEIAPYSCSLEPYQDGVAIPHHPKYPRRVLKTVNGVNVTVNPDGTVTLSYGGYGRKRGSRIAQFVRGGWKGEKFIYNLHHPGWLDRLRRITSDSSWDNLWNKVHGNENGGKICP